MNRTGLVVAVLAACFIVTVGAAGEADAASPSFPSVSEIFDTITLPDYTFQTFIDDTATVFSENMINNMVTYTSGLIDYLTTETFLSGEPEASSFTGDAGYVNIFLVLCIVIAVVCILGAMITYIANRKTYGKARKHV
ncbi:MAG: hypothetical protein ACI4Q9_03430 [Candidatus Methanomethylophilaceae archaeon]